MRGLLYFIAVLLLIAWAVGYFAMSAGGLIHVLLVLAAVAIVFRLLTGRSAV